MQYTCISLKSRKCLSCPTVVPNVFVNRTLDRLRTSTWFMLFYVASCCFRCLFPKKVWAWSFRDLFWTRRTWRARTANGTGRRIEQTHSRSQRAVGTRWGLWLGWWLGVRHSHATCRTIEAFGTIPSFQWFLVHVKLHGQRRPTNPTRRSRKREAAREGSRIPSTTPEDLPRESCWTALTLRSHVNTSWHIVPYCTQCNAHYNSRSPRIPTYHVFLMCFSRVFHVSTCFNRLRRSVSANLSTWVIYSTRSY